MYYIVLVMYVLVMYVLVLFSAEQKMKSIRFFCSLRRKQTEMIRNGVCAINFLYLMFPSKFIMRLVTCFFFQIFNWRDVIDRYLSQNKFTKITTFIIKNWPIHRTSVHRTRITELSSVFHWDNRRKSLHISHLQIELLEYYRY